MSIQNTIQPVSIFHSVVAGGSSLNRSNAAPGFRLPMQCNAMQQIIYNKNLFLEGFITDGKVETQKPSVVGVGEALRK